MKPRTKALHIDDRKSANRKPEKILEGGDP